MEFIKGDNRTQINLFPVSLEHAIDEDNEVRIIDLFVDSISLEDYWFKIEYVENGRPAYYPSDLLKLYIYGYLNKVRSSRDLEKQCKINEYCKLVEGFRSRLCWRNDGWTRRICWFFGNCNNNAIINCYSLVKPFLRLYF